MWAILYVSAQDTILNASRELINHSKNHSPLGFLFTGFLPFHLFLLFLPQIICARLCLTDADSMGCGSAWSNVVLNSNRQRGCTNALPNRRLSLLGLNCVRPAVETESMSFDIGVYPFSAHVFFFFLLCPVSYVFLRLAPVFLSTLLETVNSAPV
jgi:hypothetical protein